METGSWKRGNVETVETGSGDKKEMNDTQTKKSWSRLKLGTGIDGAVQRISRTYDRPGRLQKVTSWNAPTEGAVVNEVALAYNPFGKIASDAQSHSGAVTATVPTALKLHDSIENIRTAFNR